MLGLGLPQIILILAGFCFMLAGIYGLAPSLVTSLGGGFAGQRQRFQSKSPARPDANQTRRALQHAETARQKVELAKLTQTAPEAPVSATVKTAVAIEAAPVTKTESFFVPKATKATEPAAAAKPAAHTKAETTSKPAAAVNAAVVAKAAAVEVKAMPVVQTKPLVVEAKAAQTTPATAAISANTAPAKAEPAVFFEPKQGKVAAPAANAVPAGDADEAVVIDQELVDELFAEMFSLRSTVADLVGEVHQMRAAQRPRRFVIEEVQA